MNLDSNKDDPTLEDETAVEFSYKDLDHVPATSPGTYLAGPQDGVGDLEDYQESGYHPIHLGNCVGSAVAIV
jgi:hypothetical protein